MVAANHSAFSIGLQTKRRAIGAHQLEAQHMPPEGAGHVMVLAVNVVGDRAAHGYIFRPRRYRQKKPARNRKVQNLLQRSRPPRSAACPSSGRNAAADPCPRSAAACHSPAGKRRHSCGPAQPAIVGCRRVRQRKIAGPVQRNHLSLELGIATPGFELGARSDELLELPMNRRSPR